MLTIRNVTNTTNKMLPLRKVTSSTNKMLPIRNVTSTTNKMLPIKNVTNTKLLYENVLYIQGESKKYDLRRLVKYCTIFVQLSCKVFFQYFF